MERRRSLQNGLFGGLLVIGLYYGCHYQRVNSAPSSSNSDYYSQLIRSAIGSAQIIPKEQITDLAHEQINRKERIKRVCSEWVKSGWYQENVLPKEFDSLDEWIESKNYTDKEKTHYTDEHDSIKNLRLGGMDYLELKLQVDESHKLLYCDIPKTGSSVWMRIMLKLTQDKEWHGGNIHKAAQVENTFLYSYLPEVQVERLHSNDWYRFMFPRHPFSRILSAYRNKISTKTDRTFDKLIWSGILNGNVDEASFGKEARESLNLEPYDVLNRAFDIAGFHQFINYLVNRGPGGDTLTWQVRQKHWRRTLDVCKVCSIEWDYIGKFETFRDDYNYMFEQRGLLDVVGKLEDDHEGYGERNLYQYYEGLPKDTIQALYEVYKPDFELFGYEVPDGLL